MQLSCARYITKSSGGRSREKILIILAVAQNDEETAAIWKTNYDRLVETSDSKLYQFSFALLFFGELTGSNVWPEHFGKQVFNDKMVFPYVMYREKGCKAELWSNIAQQYAGVDQIDWFWMIDADMDLAYFHWDLFRNLIHATNAVIASGRIVGRNWHENYRLNKNLTLADGLAGYTLSTEAPGSQIIDQNNLVVHGKIWRLFSRAMMALQWDTSSIWGTEDFLSIATLALVKWCKLQHSTRPYFSDQFLVNLTPVVHKDTKMLKGNPRCVKKRLTG